MGGAAVVSALPRVVEAQTKRIAVFREQGFPRIQTADFELNFPVTFLSEANLIARLNTREFDLFVNPYGSAFPKRAWKAILEYLRGGGNWLNCGGVPLSRPAVRTGSGWRVEPYRSSPGGVCDTTMQVTDLQTKTRFPVSVPAGRISMVIIDRRNGRRII